MREWERGHIQVPWVVDGCNERFNSWAAGHSAKQGAACIVSLCACERTARCYLQQRILAAQARCNAPSAPERHLGWEGASVRVQAPDQQYGGTGVRADDWEGHRCGR